VPHGRMGREAVATLYRAWVLPPVQFQQRHLRPGAFGRFMPDALHGRGNRAHHECIPPVVTAVYRTTCGNTANPSGSTHEMYDLAKCVGRGKVPGIAVFLTHGGG